MRLVGASHRRVDSLAFLRDLSLFRGVPSADGSCLTRVCSWFIKDGKPVPSVTFKPGPGGRATIERIPVPEGGVLSAAAVTVEPAGGSQQPTSTPVLVGALQKS